MDKFRIFTELIEGTSSRAPSFGAMDLLDFVQSEIPRCTRDDIPGKLQKIVRVARTGS